MTLRPFARTALWAGGGAYVGVFLGSILIDAQRAVFWMVPWTLLFLAYVAIVALTGRDKGAATRKVPVSDGPARAREREEPAVPQPIRVTIDVPDVPNGFPAVMGAGDTFRAHITVRGPHDSAAVRLITQLRDGAARRVVGEGVVGPDGAITFDVTAPSTGELQLLAEARDGDLEGTAKTSLSIVQYADEIERLFGEFRSFAHQALGPGAETDTARELADKMRVGSSANAAKALLEIARIYELVAYGERDADRGLYLQLVRALVVLERDGEAGASDEAVTPRGA